MNKVYKLKPTFATIYKEWNLKIDPVNKFCYTRYAYIIPDYAWYFRSSLSDNYYFSLSQEQIIDAVTLINQAVQDKYNHDAVAITTIWQKVGREHMYYNRNDDEWYMPKENQFSPEDISNVMVV